MASKVRVKISLAIEPILVPQLNTFLPSDEWIIKVSTFAKEMKNNLMGNKDITYNYRTSTGIIPKSCSFLLAWATTNMKLLAAELRLANKKFKFDELLKNGKEANQVMNVTLTALEATNHDVELIKNWGLNELLGSKVLRFTAAGSSKKDLDDYTIARTFALNKVNFGFMDIITSLEDLVDAIENPQQAKKEGGAA